jgi:hypothetical protein
MAKPSLAAVVEVDDDSRRPPGHLILGIYASAGGLLAVIEDVDCARRDINIRDINIRGGNSSAVAYLLSKQGCPFVLRTGYSDWSFLKHLSGLKTLTRPYAAKEIEKHLQSFADPVALTDNSSAKAIS